MTKARDDEEAVLEYYRRSESRYGYRVFLGGTRHFGFYDDSSNPRRSHKLAILRMEQELWKRLGSVPEGGRVLDAGCGEARVASRLLRHRPDIEVHGIDLLPENIQQAGKVSDEAGVADRLSLTLGSYQDLDFSDDSFDAVYTMETLVHASNYQAALAEFKRVLKPGGTYVAFEYTMEPMDKMPPAVARKFQNVCEASGMHSFASFHNGKFVEILEIAGFLAPDVTDLTERMWPMLKWFFTVGVVPYEISRLARLDSKLPNAMSGVELYREREWWRYIVASANVA